MENPWPLGRGLWAGRGGYFITAVVTAIDKLPLFSFGINVVAYGPWTMGGAWGRGEYFSDFFFFAFSIISTSTLDRLVWTVYANTASALICYGPCPINSNSNYAVGTNSKWWNWIQRSCCFQCQLCLQYSDFALNKIIPYTKVLKHIQPILPPGTLMGPMSTLLVR